MDSTVNVITLGVRSLRASLAFYADGLGWTPKLHVPEEVAFFQVGHGLLLSLFRLDHLAAEAGGGGHGNPQLFTLAHNVDSPEAVDSVLHEAAAAGGSIVAAGTQMSWGGYSGYFADPDGFRWEVCYNPGLRVEPDGTVSIVEIA
ncbi:VOC family protein [Arthrobacter zhaoguopingii]|uniref:VOC family protein n=1 Tax=Arthrobacter zhaoguopingii TaxID=2681491 RepID=UPI00135B9606|nr:VOC family protein [Arthrobacter zhaoguopingii]